MRSSEVRAPISTQVGRAGRRWRDTGENHKTFSSELELKTNRNFTRIHSLRMLSVVWITCFLPKLGKATGSVFPGKPDLPCLRDESKGTGWIIKWVIRK